MARPRTKGRNLPEGLYPPTSKGRSFRIRHPLSGRFKSLGTSNEEKARKLHALVYPKFAGEKLRAEVEKIEQELAALGSAPSITLGQFASDMIPMIPTFRTRKGKLLAESTQQNYRIILGNLANDGDAGKKPLTIFGHPDEGPRIVRAHLAPSLGTPSWYNQRLGALSRLFNHAIDKGIIVRNPCDPVKSQFTPEREVYIGNDAYSAIIDKLKDIHRVYALCCDLIYLLSARVDDAISLTEKQITVYEDGGYVDEDGNRIVGKLLFRGGKNNVWIEMEMNEDLLTVIRKLRDYKRGEGLQDHPSLCVHPIYRAPLPDLSLEEARNMTDVAVARALGISNVAWAKRVKRYGLEEALQIGAGKKGPHACMRQLAGKRIKVAHLRERFDAAKEAAGYGDSGYTLRDLRPKGLTDEAILAGEPTNKGGWKQGSAMPGRYVKVPVPIRTKNNLTIVNKDESED